MHGIYFPGFLTCQLLRYRANRAWLICLNGLTNPSLPRGKVVSIGKQISNEEEFHLLCTAVTHRNWELSGFGWFTCLNSLCLLVMVIRTRRNTYYFLFLSTVNDFTVHVLFMAYTSFLQCTIFCSWTPGFSTGNKLKEFPFVHISKLFSFNWAICYFNSNGKSAGIQNPFARNWKVKDGFSFRMQIFLFPEIHFFFFLPEGLFWCNCLSVCVGVGKLVVYGATNNAVYLK